MSDDNRNEPEALIREAIALSEEVTDPCSSLVAQTEIDPGAPFRPEHLKALAALKKEQRASYEALRAKLKSAGCRVTALDDAIAKESGEAGGRGPTQSDILIELAQTADLFHGDDGNSYADLDINGHRETWPIRSKGFRRWLTARYYDVTGGAPGSEALQSGLSVIEARAHFGGPKREVHLRVGSHDGRLYLDLCDDEWRAVEIDRLGWRIVINPPVRFRRTTGMKPQPVPEAGGSIHELRRFLNVKSDADFVLVVSWALAVLRDCGPYPILVLSGEQGSAKSTFSAILRALLDPNSAPLRALPREDRDLFIAASNGHVLAFDNVSGLSGWISDTLCRLATGGGFAIRQLYSDQDETLFEASRPIILNGIEDIVSRPDLADRALFLTLQAIPEERRRSERELWSAFNTERPRLFGALLDAVSRGVAELPRTQLKGLPRMADFALWATACETAFSPSGAFWEAYTGNRNEAVEGVIDADPVAAAVRGLMQDQTEWTGTASDLLSALSNLAGDRVARSKSWPEGARTLSGRLRRAATFLRTVGIEIGFEREGRARTRMIRISAIRALALPETRAGSASAPSASSAHPEKTNVGNGFSAGKMRTVEGTADGLGCLSEATVRTNALNSADRYAADDADAENPSLSVSGKTGWRARL
jgi:hypothetical protein